MKKEKLIQKIKQRAKKDKAKRNDSRFKDTIGFLVTKGFLETNYPVPCNPNKRLFIEDAIWAGQTVEPRILEVLPAAVLRLEKHFDLDANKHKDLAEIIKNLRERKENGPEFYGVPFNKLKVWADLPLKDRRVKTLRDKKIPRTFRLRPQTLEALEVLAKEQTRTVTETLEFLVQNYRS